MTKHYITALNILGKRFGMLVTLTPTSEKRYGSIVWQCQCDCGNTCLVTASQLTQNRTKSCGCLKASLKRPKGLAAAQSVYNRYKKSAEYHDRSFDISFETFLQLTQQNCFYCGDPPNQLSHTSNQRKFNGLYTFNGLDRVDNSLGYTIDNVVTCCRACNIAKAQMTQQEYIDRCIKIANRHK